MQHEIMSILYNKLQISIIKSSKFIYLIILFILNINTSFKYHINIINDSKLAFNLNILYFYKNQNNNLLLQKIKINTFNKLIFKNILQNYLSLLKNKISDFNIDNISIKKNIHNLKYSGFIKKIKIILIKIDQKKIFILKIETNTVLKKIMIIDYKLLKIPKYSLVNIFKSQIGLPKNYTKINTSINKIYKWYKNKGFDWINIKIINNSNSKSLSLKIMEGKILKTILKCTSNNNLFIRNKYNIENRIIKELNILPNNILNIKTVEMGIKYLKEIKLINECTYKVIPDKDGLNLMIEYTLFKNQLECKYQNNIFFKKMFIKKYSFNKIYKDYYQSLKENIYKFFKLHLYYKNIFLTFQNKVILLNKYLYFKYIYNPISFIKEKRFIYSIKVLKKIPQLNIFLLYPNINIYNNAYLNFIAYIYKDSIYFNNIYPLQTLTISKFHQINYKKYHSILKVTGIKILFKHHVYDGIYFIEEINIVNYIIAKNTIYLNRLIENYKLQNLKKTNIYKLKSINKIIKQKIINLNLRLQYNHFSYNKKIKTGKFLLLHLMTNIYVPFINLKNIYEYKYSYKYLYFHYHQILIIPKILKIMKFNYHTIIFFLEMNLSLNQYYDSMISKFLIKQKKNIYYNLSIPQEYISPYHRSHLYHIEYNAAINNYLSFYFFSNFSCNSYKKLYLQTLSLLYLYPNESNAGYGIQLNFPVNKILPIRIEYGINNKEEKFFQLRAYSPHMEYNL